MSEVQFSFDALSFLQEVLPEPEEATPTDSIIRRPTEPKPVEAKDETQTMLQDFARLQADQYDLKSMKKAPPVKSNFIQEYLDSLDMFYKDEQMNEAINGALMEATRPPIGQLSETARTAIFSGMDMRGADKTMVNNAKEAQNVVQPMVTPVFRGRQPEMADSPALVDAPSIDTRSNEMLDKPKGIMNRPVAEALTDDDMGLPDEPVDKNSNFSVTVESLYSDFTEGGQEGTEAHIGQDSQNITLPAGIVADGLIYDGKTVTQGKNSILSKDFDPSKLDTTGAYKVVGNKKIKRSDYPSDVDFSKAVLSAFEDVAKTAAGSSWDSIKEGSKKAVVKVGWNKGPNWLKGDTAKSLYKELSKENPNASSLYSKILVGSTVKSGGASIGIAKARADSFNSIASLLGVNDITKVTADNTGKNTKFNYYDSKGNLLHTEQTSRSVDIYENGDREVVQKNSAGQW